MDDLLSNLYRFTFVTHDFESLGDIVIDAPNKHRVVVVAGEDMAVYFEKIQGLVTHHTKKLAVFVKNSSLF